MNFDSAFFLACFLPLTAVLTFFIRGNKGKNILLLAAGLLFYAFGSLSGLLTLLLAALVNYLFGLAIMRAEKRGTALTALGVALDLLLLGAFKYVDFFLSQLSPLLGADWQAAGLAAPIGISFFTFKCISYLVDTRRDKENGSRRFFDVLLYITFFPQLMAGPITRFSGFAPQLTARKQDIGSLAAGLRRFIIGLGKKLLIAAAACRVADGVFPLDGASLDFRLAWAGALAYTLQIYFDFSGYSDMAIGLGRMFGFDTPENFDYPYIATSITEFWRRWHISLSSWFRDYLYIPLGGSRRGRARTALNKFIVFALCGLWHGAAWTFILWGVWHGLLSALESLGVINTRALARSRPGRVFGRVYTLLAVCLGFVMFRAGSPAEGWKILSAMFGAYPGSVQSAVLLRSLLRADTVCMLLLGAVFATPVTRLLSHRCQAGTRLAKWTDAASYGLCGLLFLVCLTALAAGGFSPFIYFQF